MDDRRVGLALRSLRRRRGLRQVEVAEAAGIGQSSLSRIERGHLETVPLGTLRAVGAALEARVSCEIQWRGGALDRLLDERHACLAAATVSLLQRHGWSAHPEISFAIGGERGSIDVLALHAASRGALMTEL